MGSDNADTILPCYTQLFAILGRVIGWDIPLKPVDQNYDMKIRPKFN